MLGCYTLAGANAIERVQAKMNEIEGIQFKLFPNYQPSRIDGIATKENSILFIYEAKTRRASLRDNQIIFRGKAYSDYLITEEKLRKGAELSKALCTPFLLFVYFELCGTLGYFQITSAGGKIVCDYTAKETKTQATITGGKANRKNAFIDLNQLIIIQGNEKNQPNNISDLFLNHCD